MKANSVNVGSLKPNLGFSVGLMCKSVKVQLVVKLTSGHVYTGYLWLVQGSNLKRFTLFTPTLLKYIHVILLEVIS